MTGAGLEMRSGSGGRPRLAGLADCGGRFAGDEAAFTQLADHLFKDDDLVLLRVFGPNQGEQAVDLGQFAVVGRFGSQRGLGVGDKLLLQLGHAPSFTDPASCRKVMTPIATRNTLARRVSQRDLHRVHKHA